MALFGCAENARVVHFAVSLIAELSLQNFARILSVVDVLTLVSWSPILSEPSTEEFRSISDFSCYFRFVVVNITTFFSKSPGVWPDSLLALTQIGSVVLLYYAISSAYLFDVSLLFILCEFSAVFWSGDRRRQRRSWIHNASFRISRLARNPFSRSTRRSLLLPLVKADESPRDIAGRSLSPTRETNATAAVQVNGNLVSAFVDIIPEVSGYKAEKRVVHVHCMYRFRNRAPVTVVFLHQFGSGTFTWHMLMTELAERANFNLLAFDRVGHGLTFSSELIETSEDMTPISEDLSLVTHFQDAVNKPSFDSSLIEQILKFLGQTQPLVLVSSGGAGARLAIDYAAMRPFVKGVVLIAPYQLRTDGFPSVLKSVATAQVGRALTVAMARSEVCDVIPRRSWGSGNIPAPLLQAYRESADNPGWEDAMLNLLQRPIEGSVQDPHCPVLIISGQEDHFVESAEEYSEIAKEFENSSLIQLRHCGAAPQEEVPNQVCGHLIAFVSSLVSA